MRSVGNLKVIREFCADLPGAAPAAQTAATQPAEETQDEDERQGADAEALEAAVICRRAFPAEAVVPEPERLDEVTPRPSTERLDDCRARALRCKS